MIISEVKKVNLRELNPYLKDSGSGYPDGSDGVKSASHLLSSAVVGDGGASWRLKALKRAQEQAAREGRKLEEVVEERWGSMGQFAASVASHRVAPTHAHLHATRNRKKELIEEERTVVNNENNNSAEKNSDRKSTVGATPQHPRMRVPKVRDSLSWGKCRNRSMSTQDSALVSAAMSSLNRFDNDGSFMHKFVHQKNDNSIDLSISSRSKSEERAEPKSVGYESEESKEDASIVKPAMSANQLAAKALQLHMKGKHEEAEKLLVGINFIFSPFHFMFIEHLLRLNHLLLWLLKVPESINYITSLYLLVVLDTCLPIGPALLWSCNLGHSYLDRK
ncbi:unnamed protein product [Fraxinus pennsylvanica]|uniref:Uncharacterized protein n=1 Tax=Fraxinus pennsylvanica TaxID=56036 RepID=A0AAD1ZKE2_9LAMI|nr:unnamed protein product [Fraxinus pennsylvanica]